MNRTGRPDKTRRAGPFGYWRRRFRHRTQENVRELLEAAPDAMALVDCEGKIRLVNTQVEQLFGYGREELDGREIEMLIPERFRERHVQQRSEYFDAPKVRPLGAGLKLFGLRKDGSEFPVDISLSPLRTRHGLMAIAAVRDLTERQKIMQQQAVQYIVAGVLAGSATLGEAAPKLMQSLCECLGWALGQLWSVDRSANLLRHAASWHAPAVDAGAFIAASREISLAPGEEMPGRVWQSGQPEWVHDVVADPNFTRSAQAAEAGLHGAFAFPVVLGMQTLGVMAFFCRQVRPPEPELLKLLTAVGSQIGQFMERKRAEEALRLSEERYRALHRDNPTMIFTLDAGGTILSTNPFAAGQLGFTSEELEGRSVLEVFHEADRAEVGNQLRNCVRNPRQVYRWHFRKIRRDGGIRWVEELAQAVYGPEGALNILVVCQDITDRRQAEEALRQQEERFRYVAMATRDAIYDWDIMVDHLWFNDAYRELYATVGPVETTITWWERHLHPDDRQRVVASLQGAFRQRHSFWSDDYRVRRLDGSLASIMDRGYILYGEAGDPVRMIGAMTDVTDRKKALLDAEAARDRIDAILKSVSDGLLVTDLADRVLLMNDAAEALLGISRIGTLWRHIDSFPAEENLRRQIIEVRRGEREIARSEWELPPSGTGPARVLLAQTAAMRSAEGQRSGTITILRDITREREIDRMKNDFISTAAHELRTPLTTVMGYLQLLQEEARFTPEERKEFLGLVYEKSEVLDRIIRDLLDLSRVQAGKLVTLEKVREDLTRLAAHAVAAYRGVADRHRFRLEFPDEPVDLCIDPGKIGQVLDNLLSNAVKFSPAGGTICVTGQPVEGDFQVTVADEGIGMRPDELARIFDKFYRVDASDSAVAGLGLGMSIVRNIVEAHGGRIWAESEPGRGTRVHFTLPVGDLEGECPLPSQ